MDDRLQRPPVAQEVDEELSFHVEMRVRELVAAGMTEEEALREAERRFGDIDRVKASCRALGEGREMARNRRQAWDELRQDLAFAVRQLRRAPAFAAIAIATLALAIGANTAVFSVVDAVVLQPPPYGSPDRLALFWTRYLPISGFDIEQFPLSGPEALDIREETDVFQSVGLWQDGSRSITGNGQDAERISVTFVSHDVLPLLQVPPLLGRVFTAEEDVPDGPDVTVLGHDVWTRRFGADPSIVGRSIEMNGVSTQVVGVMPEGFAFTRDAEAYLPMGMDRTNEGGRGGHGLYLVGRLRPDRTWEDAHAELSVFAERWAAEYQHNVGHYAWTEPLKDALVGDAREILRMLMAAVALVLLVACANVTNLLLARAERRQSEVAVRAAMGAGSGRLVRQLVTESLVLAGAGAVVGIGLAWLGTGALIRIAPDALPRLDDTHVSLATIGFTLGAAILTALIFGTLPAVLAGRRATARIASTMDRATGSRQRRALHHLLVGGEVALCLVVVILAGLVARSFAALASTDPGFEPENVLAFRLTLPSADYPESPEVPLAYVQLLDRLRAVPGVTSVSASSSLPFSGSRSRWDFQLDDRPARQEGDLAWNAGVAMVAPNYFETMGIELLEGRGITAGDGADDAWVGVVSREMARVYWPGESPIGKRWGYQQTADSITWITVVGMVEDPVVARVDAEVIPFVYIPMLQVGRSAYGWPRSMDVAVRSALEPWSATPAVRAAVRDFDPDLPLYAVRTMEDAVSSSLAEPRLTTNLLGLFALLALALSAVGIYGVVSYSVAGRTRELGVRLALGAGAGRVQRLVLAEGAAPVVLGIVVGLAAAWFATRLVASFLYGVEPTDPLTFVALPLALLAVGLFACWLPARRATRVAPTVALRES